MVEQYKIQDRKGQREIPKEDYINAQWFMDNIISPINVIAVVLWLYIRY
jgi:Tfp pilus assembly protein PilF